MDMAGTNSERYENSSLLFKVELKESEKIKLSKTIQNDKHVMQIWVCRV